MVNVAFSGMPQIPPLDPKLCWIGGTFTFLVGMKAADLWNDKNTAKKPLRGCLHQTALGYGCGLLP